jgi:preprotein translocase subunit SecE
MRSSARIFSSWVIDFEVRRFGSADMAKAIVVPNGALQQMKDTPTRVRNFLHDVRSERRKVITPTRDEVQTTTVVVIVTVFIFAAYFWLVDNIIGHAIELLLKKLSGH